MTKKKNLIARICGLLIVLTLISCCFLGTTFARYTSNVKGTASVQVAKWDIDFERNDTATTTLDLEFDKLSPNQTDYTDASGADVAWDTALKEVATISNNSDVAALVTVAMSEMTINYTIGEESASITYTADNASSSLGTASDNTVVTLEEIHKRIELALYSNAEGTTTFSSEGIRLAAKNGDTVASTPVMAEVTWTTPYHDSTTSGVHEDAIDTWIGEHVTSIEWTITITAVQDSQLPTT